MKLNLTAPDLSCHQLTSKVCDIQEAADAAAAPYKGGPWDTNKESILPYVLNKDEHLREMLLAQSTEMLVFIWDIVQLGERNVVHHGETIMKLGDKFSRPDFTSSGKSLMFVEVYFENQKQKRACKDKRRLVQKIIKTPYLDMCLMEGIEMAKFMDLLDADFADYLLDGE